MESYITDGREVVIETIIPYQTININKIIYYHSKNCKNAKIKHVGDLHYHVDNVDIELLNHKQLEEFRKTYKKKSNISIIDFRYVTSPDF